MICKKFRTTIEFFSHCPTCLKIQIPNPVDKVEEAKGGRKEYSGIRVDFGDMDVHSVFTPGSSATVIEAAEETGAVFPIQTFIGVIIVLVVGSNVVHLQQGCPWSDVNHAGFLCMARLGLLVLPVACEVVQSPILHKSSEGEDETDRHKQIHGRHI